jgi:esterase/lipase superfamily enzyme
MPKIYRASCGRGDAVPQFGRVSLAILFSISVYQNAFADVDIEPKIILQICQAFSKKAPDQMPSAVSSDAVSKFFETYGHYADQLEGCLSAKEFESSPTSVTYLLQNTRYESYWRFSLEGGSIQKIEIGRFRPITLSDDEKWVYLAFPPLPATESAEAFSDTSNPNIAEFFYATNRKVSEESARIEGNPQPSETVNGRPRYTSNGWTAVSDYTGDRTADLSYGAIRIRVPEGHRIGKLELPSELKVFGVTFWSDSVDPKKHFIIRSIQKTDEDRWIKSVSLVSSSKDAKTKKALIFVHGFNTKFRDAAFRTAQIVWDLQFDGVVVLFSWPSRGEIADYFYDQNSALNSRDALLHVISDLNKAEVGDISIVAHSMGNLIAVDALSNSAATKSPVAIAELIMAAPDVDRDMFLREIPRVAQVAKNLTLYASANDKALQLSKRVAGDIPRAGDVPASGPVVVPPMATIDVSAIGDEIFGLNHSTFATTRNVLNDLRILLQTGAPPPRLAEVRAYPEPPEKPAYFRYAP